MDAPRSDNTTKSHEAPVKVGPNATRPGPLGRPVAVVLACALALAAIVWVAAEYWGEAQDGDTAGMTGRPVVTGTAPREATAPSQSDPANSAPTVSGPTPPTETGGNSQSAIPNGTTAPQQ